MLTTVAVLWFTGSFRLWRGYVSAEPHGPVLNPKAKRHPLSHQAEAWSRQVRGPPKLAGRLLRPRKHDCFLQSPHSQPTSVRQAAGRPAALCQTAPAGQRRGRRLPTMDMTHSLSARQSPGLGWPADEPGAPITFGSAAAVGVWLIVWCRDCGHQVKPDPGEMVARDGADVNPMLFSYLIAVTVHTGVV
jgi:hypothetical protein